jgi:hypothetical protein
MALPAGRAANPERRFYMAMVLGIIVIIGERLLRGPIGAMPQ